jgi:prepilin-type N-terminal cleavage/methylation domain-containing protein
MRRAGLTLVELMIALAVLAVALLTMLASVAFANRNTQRTREMIEVENGVRLLVEQMYDECRTNTSFGQIFTTYRDQTDEIELTTGGNVKATVRYEFPVDDNGSLIENPAAVSDPDLRQIATLLLGSGGMDLNGDGDTDDSMTSGYDILPVRIVAEWNTPTSTGVYRVPLILYPRVGP